jgi:hypothetical protein
MCGCSGRGMSVHPGTATARNASEFDAQDDMTFLAARRPA